MSLKISDTKYASSSGKYNTVKLYRKQILILLFAGILSSTADGQTVAPSPLIRHYSANIEKLSVIRGIVPTKSGTLIFPGEVMFTEYDGHQFKPLFQSAISSADIDPADSTMYVGAFADFGYIVVNERGKPELHHLKRELLPDSTPVHVKHVIVSPHKVFFLSNQRVFEYDKAEKKSLSTARAV